jgi:small GTP-binding protein
MGLLSVFRRNKIALKGNVAFIGLGFAGKTTVLNRLRNNEFTEDSIRTMGLNVDAFEYNGIKFSAFDLGGQETFRMIWEPYVSNAIAVVYVIDASAFDLYPESASVLHDVLKYIRENATLLILANKSDLAALNSLDHIVESFDFFKLQNSYNLKRINIFYVSAKTGDQFDDAFDWLADSVTKSIKSEK